MSPKLLVLVVLWMAAAGENQMAKAQSVDFSCPRTGTAETRARTDVVQQTTWRYIGVSDYDPYVCNRVDSLGQKQSFLFNYLQVNEHEKEEGAREAFIALLSGSQKSITYEWFSPLNRKQFHEEWTILRHETLIVDGKPFDTIVFSRRSHTINGVWVGDYTLWLDPKSGLWLRSEYRILAQAGGIAATLSANYKDVLIALAQ